jgi:DNA-binding response OmpR family regulator
VRLIALTGWGSENDQRLAMEAGFDVHCTKPVDLDVLAGLLVVPQAASSEDRADPG